MANTTSPYIIRYYGRRRVTRDAGYAWSLFNVNGAKPVAVYTLSYAPILLHGRPLSRIRWIAITPGYDARVKVGGIFGINVGWRLLI